MGADDINQERAKTKNADGFFDAIGKFFTSWGASGAAWQLTLCSFLGLIIIFYLIIHCYKQGSEYVQLNKDQMQTLNNLMLNFYDSVKQADVPAVKDSAHIISSVSSADSLKPAGQIKPSSPQPAASTKNGIISNQPGNNRSDRDILIIKYLQNEYNGNLDGPKLDSLKDLLHDFNNKDAGNFLKDKRLLSKSFFWLTGAWTYFEAWLWSLIGVLVSLVYYVSIANAKFQNTAGDEDSGPFDPKAVPAQIAKTFYAPVCTLVLVLGYHYLSDKNGNMVDIAVNKGLIIFSFICGFFSGRVMKFLDNLKDLVLPLSGTSKPPGAGNSAPKTEITFKLQLSDKMKNDPDAAAINATGFKDAEILITPPGGGKSMKFKKLPDEKGNAITVKQLTAGNYTLTTTMAFRNTDNNNINLENTQPIIITSDTKEFTIALDKV